MYTEIFVHDWDWTYRNNERSVVSNSKTWEEFCRIQIIGVETTVEVSSNHNEFQSYETSNSDFVDCNPIGQLQSLEDLNIPSLI